MLARLAASAHNSQSADDEAAIEKYLRSVLSLENILTLDRLRQVDGRNFSFRMIVRTPITLTCDVRVCACSVLGGGREGAADHTGEKQQTEPQFSVCAQGNTDTVQPFVVQQSSRKP